MCMSVLSQVESSKLLSAQIVNKYEKHMYVQTWKSLWRLGQNEHAYPVP